MTPERSRRVAAGELAAAVVMESPRAAGDHGVRIDSLLDEPLPAALPAGHEYAGAQAIPVGAFLAEVLLPPAEPPGQKLDAWFRAVLRAVGFAAGRCCGP